MWFLLRMTFWLGLVLVLLPSFGSQPVPKSEVGMSEALSATKGAVTDLQNFCERQKETCAAALQAAITLGQRAQAGAKELTASAAAVSTTTGAPSAIFSACRHVSNS